MEAYIEAWKYGTAGHRHLFATPARRSAALHEQGRIEHKKAADVVERIAR